MKKVFILFLILVLCTCVCACGNSKSSTEQTTNEQNTESSISPKERLPELVKSHISTNYQYTVGDSHSEAVNVDIAQIVEKEENQYVVLGTYTIKINSEIKSAKFGLVATYDKSSDQFSYSNVKFEDFE